VRTVGVGGECYSWHSRSTAARVWTMTVRSPQDQWPTLLHNLRPRPKPVSFDTTTSWYMLHSCTGDGAGAFIHWCRSSQFNEGGDPGEPQWCGDSRSPCHAANLDLLRQQPTPRHQTHEMSACWLPKHANSAISIFPNTRTRHCRGEGHRLAVPTAAQCTGHAAPGRGAVWGP
jgi:hypothetical protein